MALKLVALKKKKKKTMGICKKLSSYFLNDAKFTFLTIVLKVARETMRNNATIFFFLVVEGPTPAFHALGD